MLKQLRPALVVLAALTGLTGIVYPCVVTVVAQVGVPPSGQRQPHLHVATGPLARN